MTTLSITSRVLRSSRPATTVWALALAAVTAMYIAFYPSVGSLKMEGMVKALPEAMVKGLGYDQIATAAGYLNSTVYSLLGMVLLSVYAIGTGARLIGASEESGALELEFAAPVTRRQIYLQRLLALVTGVTALAVVVGLVALLLVALLDLDVQPVNLLAGTVGLWLWSLLVGVTALAVGAVTGRRGAAVAVGSAVAVVSFMLNAIGPATNTAWMTTISPFSWYVAAHPLANGFDWAGLGKLALVGALVAVLGLRVFRRRDLMV
ncbi:MAG TPA: ABC transporter permease subunit [Dermatophilaceae bacterium]|nr:ABC transporter permease subunit [Dermatophilaceae bacterium]